jgi:hypothetical protein
MSSPALSPFATTADAAAAAAAAADDAADTKSRETYSKSDTTESASAIAHTPRNT